MKYLFKSLVLPLVAAAGVSIPLVGHAQSSITLWGRVVGGVEYIDQIKNPTTGNTSSLTRAAGNQWGTSMFGLRGSEDLGGGLKAVFNLESGFNLPDSALNGTAFFNRRAYVGLSSSSWGTLTIGKNLLISNDVWDLDPTGQQVMSSATLVRGRSWQGADNMIEYRSPDFGGFSLGAQIGLAGATDSTKRLRSQGLSASYQNGNLLLRGIYSERRDAAGLYSDVYTYSKDAILGGTYRVGAAKLYATYERVVAPGAGQAPSGLKHVWVGVRYDLTPALTLIGAAYHVKSDQPGGAATLGVIGLDYNLSKRTFFYASLGGVSNGRNANYAADVTVNGAGAGRSQRVIYAGMGHSF